MQRFIVSFDVDGTLGRQRSTIQKNDYMDFDHVVEIENDHFGAFVFHKGMINLLKKVVEIIRKYQGFLILCTGGVKTYGSLDRNIVIIKYLQEILNYDVKLYDVRYQTFNKSDIEDALNEKIDNVEWQEWFRNLFRIHTIDELHIVDLEDEFDTYFVRDHSLILSKHPDIYNSIPLHRIIHIDDTPKSVKSLTSSDFVHLIEWKRNQIPQTQCDEIYINLLNFL